MRKEDITRGTDVFEELGKLALEHDPNYEEATRAIKEIERVAVSTDFLNKLYEESLKWLLEEQGCKVIAEFGPQEIPHWQYGADLPDRVFDLEMNLQKGVVLEDNTKRYALALGVRRTNGYEREEGLSFQFGVVSISDYNKPEATVDEFDLKFIANIMSGHYGKGEFHLKNDEAEMDVSCWVESVWALQAGRKRLNDWDQEELLSDRGFKASMGLVKDTLTRASFG